MSSPNVRELLPLSVYERSLATTMPRLGVFAALLWFAYMTITHVVVGRSRLGATLPLDAIGALIFGILFAVGIRWSMTRLTQQLYDGSASIMAAEPSGHYDFRVFSSLIRSRIAVGGHLYVGPENWIFVPHKRNLRAHRLLVRWNQPDRLSLSTEPAPRLLSRLASRSIDRLVVSDGPSRRLFIVPDAQRVRDELTWYLRQMHATPDA